MTDRKTEEAVKFARASLALDGLTPSPEAEAKVRAQLDTYRGETYRAASGQWAWVIYQNDEDYCRGAGYPDEEEAEQALCEALMACGCFLPDDHDDGAEPPAHFEAEEGRRHKGGYRCHQPRGVTGAGKHLVTRGQPAQAQALRPRPALPGYSGRSPRYPLTHAETAQNGLQRVFTSTPPYPRL